MHYLIFTIWMAFHPVHVSLTSIDLVPGTDSLKVFIRIYYDDFIRDFGSVAERNTDGDDFVPGASDLEFYLAQKVKIQMNNKELKGKLLNRVLDNNELSVNLLYRSVKKPGSITVENTINTAIYNDQANMVILRINNLDEGFKLTGEETAKTFKLERKQE